MLSEWIHRSFGDVSVILTCESIHIVFRIWEGLKKNKKKGIQWKGEIILFFLRFMLQNLIYLLLYKKKTALNLVVSKIHHFVCSWLHGSGILTRCFFCFVGCWLRSLTRMHSVAAWLEWKLLEGFTHRPGSWLLFPPASLGSLTARWYQESSASQTVKSTSYRLLELSLGSDTA